MKLTRAPQVKIIPKLVYVNGSLVPAYIVVAEFSGQIRVKVVLGAPTQPQEASQPLCLPCAVVSPFVYRATIFPVPSFACTTDTAFLSVVKARAPSFSF